MLKPLTVWNTAKCGRFLKRWEYQTTLPASWETCMQVKKQQLGLNMGQQTGSKLWNEYIKVVYWPAAYLTSMQSTSCKMLDWMKHNLELRLQGEISIICYADDTTLMAENEEEPEVLSKGERGGGSGKAGLKLNLNFQKMKIMAACPISSWQFSKHPHPSYINIQFKKKEKFFSSESSWDLFP